MGNKPFVIQIKINSRSKNMDARKVVSPKSKVNHVEVIYDNGTFAIASLQWDKKNQIAIRWNGSDDDSLGYPQSHGYPTWFVIPKEVALAYAQNLKNTRMENIIKASSDEPFV